MEDIGQNIMYLWGAGCLVALFGIWYTLWSRLSKPTQEPRMTRKEREAMERQAEIEEAATRMLTKMQGGNGKGDKVDITPSIPSVSPPANQPASERIRNKYRKESK